MPNESKRSIHVWFLGFASVLLAIALGVLFNAAGDLTEAAVNFKNLIVKQPRFADFVGPQRYELLMKKISKRPPNNLTEKTPAPEPVKGPAPVGDQRLELDPAVQKTFEFLADYENKLSRPSLQIIKPVVAALEPGSFAELSGHLRDLILTYFTIFKAGRSLFTFVTSLFPSPLSTGPFVSGSNGKDIP